MRYRFVTGHAYAAGFDKPFVASESAIREAVEDKGFRVLYADECERTPVLPFHTPGTCDDEWDWIALVERTGPSTVLEVPDRVKWIIDTTPAAPGEPVRPPTPLQPEPEPLVVPGFPTPLPSPAGVAQARGTALWLVAGAIGGYFLVTKLAPRVLG
jgi:hypothetical protein